MKAVAGIIFVIAAVGVGGYFYNNPDKLPSLGEDLSQETHQENFVTVKYRDSKVDIGHPRFEYLDTSKSSNVRGAWYDDANQYMVINLGGTNYHYCGLPTNIWNNFQVADSFGTHYHAYIKGNYDCRVNYVPSY